ncbi:MAG: hypothetical protein ACYTHJ_21840, partial [Planctomycetota bacterium]
AGPDPIKITRGGGKVFIPDVPRDQVIGFALYTVQDKTLKLSAQLYPLQAEESRQIKLQIKKASGWETLATEVVDEIGWMATFRVKNWDHSRDYPYRVTHPGGATYEGLIRKDPIDKETIVVAGFTGNSNADRSQRTDIVKNIQTHDPDLLFFSGDQSYDHREHTAAWLLFGRQFGEIIKDRPTVAIPDDHDVGQGNLWGEGGKVSTLSGGSDGGYTMPADYVRMVERAQTGHLPDPFDPTPILQGIGVYYTNLTIGGVDFAVIEDRKFKSGPAGMIPKMGPRPDHINDPSYDRKSVDVPEAQLLGQRQLNFLDAFGQDWDGVQMKAVLSQTIFAGGAHIHGGHKGRLLADLDSNGWPQSGRQRAIHAIRKFYGFHLAGDQHLATVIHHGTQSFNDSIYSFCVPSIVNYYGRWWWPLEDPVRKIPGNDLPFAGQFYDGLGNKVSMHAYANPTTENYNAAGYGIVRFNKTTRDITMECWPRHVDVTDPNTKQFPGWPVTINQLDNYARKPIAMLPTLKINADDPVVQVIEQDHNTVVYTLRINGSSFQPKVFAEGDYTVKVTANGKTKTVKDVSTIGLEEKGTLEIKL